MTVRQNPGNDGTNQKQAIRLLADADSDGIKIITYFDGDPDLDANNLSKLVRNIAEIREPQMEITNARKRFETLGRG